MKRGGQKTASNAPGKRTRARTAPSPALALTDSAIAAEAKPALKRKSRDNTKPRQKTKGSLLAFMLSDDRLSPEAKARIKRAATESVTPDALGAFAHYSVELARQ